MYSKLLSIMDVKYVLDEVQFREEEMETINDFLFKKQENSKNYLVITGQPGSGKTALVKDILNKLVRNTQNTTKAFMHNANKFKRIEDFYKILTNELSEENNSKGHLQDLYDVINRLKTQVIICVDEFERLLKIAKNKKEIF